MALPNNLDRKKNVITDKKMPMNWATNANL
jgi:hypothetical protein